MAWRSRLSNFVYKTTGTQSNGAVLTEGGFIGMATTPEQDFAASVNRMLDSRSGYDGLDRHEVAHRVARVTGYTEVEVYNVLIAVKDARADIAAERGEFHADSAHDAACYRKLKADYIAGK